MIQFLTKLSTNGDCISNQRWIYRVDYTRTNEFGQQGEPETETETETAVTVTVTETETEEVTLTEPVATNNMHMVNRAEGETGAKEVKLPTAGTSTTTTTSTSSAAAAVGTGASIVMSGID